MAENSSRTTALRALFMLSCLIAIPAVAVSGLSVPDTLGACRAGARALFRGSDMQGPSPRAVRPLDSLAADGSTPATGRPIERSRPLGQGPTLAVAAVPARASRVAAATMVDHRGGGPARAVPVDTRPSSRPAAMPVSAVGVPELAEGSDCLAQAEQRLRRLGATHYLLESWGADGELFRFHCRVAVAGSPTYTRYFEATDADPLAAVGDVLAQIESWRSGG